jgi:hypothetical protein
VGRYQTRARLGTTPKALFAHHVELPGVLDEVAVGVDVAFDARHRELGGGTVGDARVVEQVVVE